MSIIHITTSLSRLGGGIPPVVWALACHQRQLGLETAVMGVRDEFTAADAQKFPNVPHFAAQSPVLGWFSSMHRLLKLESSTADVFHVHGLWQLPGVQARKIAHKMNVPLVVTPHGMLEPWALRQSAWKKKLAGWLYENRNLRSAACIHALCRAEADHCRDFGLRNPIAVIPNGIDVQSGHALADREAFAESFPQARGRKVLLFLARIHPKKGLPHLLKAWSRLARQAGDWLLVVTGPDEGGHLAMMKGYSIDLGITDRVLFTGPLYGQAKNEAYAAADGFVLPSFSEGFSMSILEAASFGLPILYTRQCNFPQLAAEAGGFEIEPDEESVKTGAEMLLTMSDEQRKAMGARARELVMREYSWAKAAERLHAVYVWLLKGGSPPACVIMD